MTRTEMLALEIEKIYMNKKSIIDALPTCGPKGGVNAKHIEGWKKSGNGTVTMAVNIAQVPTLKYWSGKLPTPSTAIPVCIYDECFKAYHNIFG